MDRARFHIRQILVYFKASYQYRVHFLGIVIRNLAIFILFFLFFRWTGKLGDLSDRALITYYLLLLGFFSHMIPIVDLSFTEKLRSGKLDSILTMPVDLKLYFVTLHLENLMFNWILNSIFLLLYHSS
ncbi:MAG: ABC-2 family transporter protein [Candidatus Hydrothermia bacterium]